MTGCGLESLGHWIAEEQDTALARQELSSVERRIIEHAWVGRRRRGTTRFTWAMAALLPVAIGVAFGWWREHGPLRFEIDQRAQIERGAGGIGAWIAAPEADAIPVRFSDGTRVLFAAGARARITQADRKGVGIVVERGQLDFSVVHHAATRWSIATGPFAVTVTGTEFDLDWQPETETLQLHVRAGSVLVTGCQFGEGRSVSANEMLRTRCGDTLSVTTTRGAETAGSAEATPSARPGPEPDSVARESASDSVSPVTAPTWQAMARRGHFRTAFEQASRAGFEAECARVTAPELALLMDVARYAGHVDRAEEAARALRSRFAGKPQAALAAFTLGRIAFDRASDYGDAARWFRVYLSEQPGGALAREAEGRLMESLSRSGQASSARQVAREYLERYPEGPHARLARQLIGS